MKKLLLAAAFATVAAGSASAYFIGGEYATLLSCNWGQYGYQHGWIGTYQTGSGGIYNIFFGSNYCQY